MRRLKWSLVGIALFLLGAVAAAQPGIVQTIAGKLRITSTASDALCVGGSGVSPASTACTGGIYAGALQIGGHTVTSGFGLPATIWTTEFANTSNRYVGAAAGGCTYTFGTTHGLVMDTTTSSTSGCLVQIENWRDASSGYTRSPLWSCRLNVETVGTDYDIFVGLAEYSAATGGPITDTTRRIGFKITRSASGTTNVFATQSDGSTENKTNITTGAGVYDFAFKVNGTSSVDYYYATGTNAWSSATNQTSNMPTAAGAVYETFMISNRSTTSQSKVYVYIASDVR